MPAAGPLHLAPTPGAEHEMDRDAKWSEVALSPRAAGTPGGLIARGTAVDQALEAGSPSPDVPTVPVWLHRLHGDGLPTTQASSATPRALDSQRFVKRWKGAAGGY